MDGLDGARPAGVDSVTLEQGSLWPLLSAKWDLLASPVRPCAEDVRIAEDLFFAEASRTGAHGRQRACLLGVTPEIATVPWLEEFDLVAVERVQAMIDSVWPGNTANRCAVRADWRRLPFPDECFDLLIGDGCLTPVGFPDELAQFLASLHRCLRQGGYLMLRLFCRPDVPETPDSVIAALRAGAIGSIHAFKWRLSMALQASTDAPDVAVNDVWQAWRAANFDANALAAARGWSPETVATMEFYRGSLARNNFMPFERAIACLQDCGFEHVATRTGSYELAERCPHVLLRKRGSSGAGA